jgi:hypothetical protein
MAEIAETCPHDDRTPDRKVFHGFSPDVAKNGAGAPTVRIVSKLEGA